MIILLKSTCAEKVFQVFASLLFICSSFNVHAAVTTEPPSVRKELKLKEFKNLNIAGDISVVLTNDPPGTVSIEGDEKNFSKIKYDVKDNTLNIDVNQWLGYKKLTVYLSAITLYEVQLNGNADVSSNEILKSDKLHLLLNGNISVKIRTTGKVSIDSPEDIALKHTSKLIPKQRSF